MLEAVGLGRFGPRRVRPVTEDTKQAELAEASSPLVQGLLLDFLEACDGNRVSDIVDAAGHLVVMALYNACTTLESAEKNAEEFAGNVGERLAARYDAEGRRRSVLPALRVPGAQLVVPDGNGGLKKIGHG